LGEKWIITLAVVCLAIIIGGSLVVGEYFFELLEAQIAKQIQETTPHYVFPNTTPYRSINFTSTNITTIHQDIAIYNSPDKPHIITSALTAQDVRTGYSYSIHIRGRINNTGGSTAYNAALHIIAMNNDGTAIDTNYSFMGITAHMSLGLDFSLPYSGSPIDNCTITPVYQDSLQSLNNTVP
jgi:hypothetical protein